ncbi:hypothetical protein [Tautonia plasticadhaerens]|uniref:Uncharacterized protein n=1 Tax=Tautonia plasticadhaerens TaxID=2527974 RepID=A0A518GXP0_9BACT|nr:hypothetical protein [Tautonia plasticadhaerens]QDV33364.1 hypothetical protein ElP_12350 [Tautonia plasticadhaerens]
MTLRFLLVGAVAALGFDLPSGIDVDAWTHSGRTWWHTRVAEFEARHGIALVEVEDVPSPSPPACEAEALPSDDAAFATVIEDVVSAFAADVAIARAEEPEDSSQLVAGVDDVSHGPEFADALNRWADGLSEPATLALWAGGDSDSSDPEVDPIGATATGFAGPAFASEVVLDDEAPLLASTADSSAGGASEDPGVSPSGTEGPGFSQAVRLTGQALQAWLALVQTATPTVSPSP